MRAEKRILSLEDTLFSVEERKGEIVMANLRFEDLASIEQVRKICLGDRKIEPSGPVRVERGKAHEVRLASGAVIIVRECLRGGILGKLNRRIYFWRPGLPWLALRPFRELQTLAYLLARKIAVPTPALALIERCPRNFCYTAFVGTESIRGAKNLLTLGGPGRDDAGPRELFLSGAFYAGREVRKMLEAGIFHPDLHLGNVLVDPEGGAWLIDFDRASWLSSGRLEWAMERLIARWGRSAEKHGLAQFAVKPFISGLKQAVVIDTEDKWIE